MDTLSTDSLTAITAEDLSSHRSGSRDSLLLSAQLRVGETETVTVRVRNLSSGGLMAEYGQPVSAGTGVQVEVRGIGWVAGRIAWTAEGRVGIAFDHPIDPLAARKPVGTPRSASYRRPVKPVF